MKNKLTASSLKEIMWESMQELKAGSLNPQVANAMATNCREILRVIRVQLQILNQTNREVTTDLVNFSDKAEDISEGRVVQKLERGAHNAQDVGAIPAAPTIIASPV